MVRHITWLACLLLTFVLGLHLLAVAANRRNPPHYPSPSWAMMALFVLEAFSWIAALVYRQMDR